MSRSWERKVRKNMSQVNKQRKKQGLDRIQTGTEKSDRFVGRSFILPLFLLFFIGIYFIMAMMTSQSFTSIQWWTVAAYIVLALIFFLRRPYLTIGKDYVQTRRFAGDRRLSASQIKSITVQRGSIMIEPVKGANWMFSKAMNRYPTEEIAERLQEFAKANGTNFIQK